MMLFLLFILASYNPPPENKKILPHYGAGQSESVSYFTLWTLNLFLDGTQEKIKSMHSGTSLQPPPDPDNPTKPETHTHPLSREPDDGRKELKIFVPTK